MYVGFFTVMRSDPQHFLHAAALVTEVRRVMPDAWVYQLTDETTDRVPGVAHTVRVASAAMLLEQRLAHYRRASGTGEWLFLDTDVSVRADVRSVFDDPVFDVALTDRRWPHHPQTPEMLHTMPFNAGVAFSRSADFWADALAVCQDYPADERNWWSEQRAIYYVVRSGRYRVKILPGQIYNYPPASADDRCVGASLVHYKGDRKRWRSQQAGRILGAAALEFAQWGAR